MVFHIASLPNEMLTHILKYCATPSLSSVCRKWRDLLASDSEIMRSIYKQIVEIHVPRGNVREHAVILNKIYKLDNELLPGQKIKAIFKQIFTLAKPLSPLRWKDHPKENIYFTSANYSSYVVNISRLLMWNKLPGGKKYLDQQRIKHLSIARKGELFKGWIERYGKDIKNLSLAGTGLTFLPPEIGQLSQLQALYLNGTQLTILWWLRLFRQFFAKLSKKLYLFKVCSIQH
jgi:Leucine-rich repeat (LRR) protein